MPAPKVEMVQVRMDVSLRGHLLVDVPRNWYDANVEKLKHGSIGIEDYPGNFDDIINAVDGEIEDLELANPENEPPAATAPRARGAKRRK